MGAKLMAFKYLVLAVFALATSAFSSLLKYPNPMPKVSTTYDTILLKTWEGIKKRNVNAYSTGLVHRPKSNSPDDAVSEGVSYGMFLALYANDQAYFNSIWNAGEKFMWNDWGNYYDWRRNPQGGDMGDGGPASDAEQDIALLLIFADQLVKNKIWSSYTSNKGATYAGRARSILGTIRGSMIDQGKYLMPGHWGGAGTLNPGYFAPAFYRIFGEFEPEHKATWNALINGSYEVIARSPGYSKGLIPDWCTASGGSTGGAGYNAYFSGDALYRDAVRVYWRLATDYLWYGEPRAKTFLDNAINFLKGKGGPGSANFFDMNGNLLPAGDTETLGLGKQNIVRTRREHSHLTVGMWAAAAMGSGGATLAESYSDELLKFYKSGTDYWGYASDPNGGTEDTLHNEMYFDQFLAWFGASVLGGVFANVWDDLKDGVPQGPPEWKKWPVLNTQNVDASKEPLKVSASFTNSTRWTATLTNDLNGNTVTFGAKSDTVSFTWYGLSETGSYMPQGFYTLTIGTPGLETYSAKIWLGKPYASSLMRGKRLLVDDFADENLIPYIGNEWRSYLDAHDGAGSSTGQLSVGSDKWLSWRYTLTGGGDPYAALEWNCSNPTLNVKGIDSIIVIAKSGGSNIGVSVQLISPDFNFPSEYQYFEDSLKLTSAQQEFRLPISRFKQRMNGEGKDKNKTLERLTGIRFHIQSGGGSTGTIMMKEMYFTGDVSNFYTISNPPDYKAPTGTIPPPPTQTPPTPEPPEPPEAIRIAQHSAYSIRKSSGMVYINLQPNMAGASVTLMDTKGRVVKKMNVSQNAELNISMRDLATGIYFAEVKKSGSQRLILTIPPM
jgi:endo-1,4-beta-D-glucanase Y